jgi:hypothetical protein|tara:strand:- start:265 stop:492 length:228 start_codon:yes stop_codon:yes gene_type:complete
MAKQEILFAKNGSNASRQEAYEVKLPKTIQHVSPFEMQFGMKQPSQYRCRHGEPESVGVESTSIPGFGYTNNVRL